MKNARKAGTNAKKDSSKLDFLNKPVVLGDEKSIAIKSIFPILVGFSFRKSRLSVADGRLKAFILNYDVQSLDVRHWWFLDHQIHAQVF